MLPCPRLMAKRKKPEKEPAAGGKEKAVAEVTPKPAPQPGFDEVLELIDAARARALAAVNTALIDLYWKIGEHINRRIAADGWGQGTVQALAQYIQARNPGVSGYSAQNLWRMRQFVETYRDLPKLSPLVRELSWTHNLLILGKCKRDEEREFYLRLCLRERWSKREPSASSSSRQTLQFSSEAGWREFIPGKAVMPAPARSLTSFCSSR